MRHGFSGQKMCADAKQTIVHSNSTIEGVPIRRAFEYLSEHDLCTCARVCRKWRDLAADDAIWKTRAMKRFNMHLSHRKRTITERDGDMEQHRRWKNMYMCWHQAMRLPRTIFTTSSTAVFTRCMSRHSSSACTGVVSRERYDADRGSCVLGWLSLFHTDDVRVHSHTLREPINVQASPITMTETEPITSITARSLSITAAAAGRESFPLAEEKITETTHRPPSTPGPTLSQAALVLKIVLQFIDLECIIPTRIGISLADVRLHLKDGNMTPAYAVDGHGFIAFTTHAASTPPCEDDTVTLEPNEIAVLRIALPLSADALYEPEAMEMLAEVSIPYRLHTMDVTKHGIVSFDMRNRDVEAGIWRCYRLQAGSGYAKIDREADGGFPGCVLLSNHVTTNDFA